MQELLTVGNLFRAVSVEDIEAVMTPSFHGVIRSTLEGVKLSHLATPKEAVENTLFTPALRRFLSQVVEALGRPGIFPLPLVKGFGFGKTHAMILLWHMFTSPRAILADLSPDDRKALEDAGYSEQLAEDTLVIACDVSAVRVPPLATVLDVVKAQGEIAKIVKSRELFESIYEALRDIEDERAIIADYTRALDLITSIGKGMNKRGKLFRLLVLVDELGLGTVRRVRELGKGEAEREVLDDAERLMNFLSELPVAVQERGLKASVVIVYAAAEQDLRDLETEAKSLYAKKRDRDAKLVESLKDRIIGMTERLLRHTGGVVLTALSPLPDENIRIALFRVLKARDEAKIPDGARRALEFFTSLVEQLGLVKSTAELETLTEKVKEFYPVSPDLVDLLVKSQNPKEAPATEFIRSAMLLLADAANQALDKEPSALMIGVRHLKPANAYLSSLLPGHPADIKGIWDEVNTFFKAAVKDIERKRGSEDASLARHMANLILARAVTTNIELLLDPPEEAITYGTRLKDIQISVILTAPLEKITSFLEKANEILRDLELFSFKIRRKELKGEEYVFPLILRKSVYAKLHELRRAEISKLEEKGPVLYLAHEGDVLNSLLAQIPERRPSDYALSVPSYAEISQPDVLASKAEGLLGEGIPSIIMVKPWDIGLEQAVKERGYENLLQYYRDTLNRLMGRGKISRPSLLVLLLPELTNIRQLAEAVAEYNAHMAFLGYLGDEERLVRKLLEDIEAEAIKTRRGPPAYDVRKRKDRIKKAVEAEIREAEATTSIKLTELSRRIVGLLLSSYARPIYYALRKGAVGSFEVLTEISDVKGSIERLISGQNYRELERYADMVGKFFSELLKKIGFEKNISTIVDYFKRHLKDSYAAGVVPDRIMLSDLVENMLSGAYGVRPWGLDVVNKAIERLHGQSIDVEDAVIRLEVDSKAKLLTIQVIQKKPRPSLSVAKTTLTLLPGEEEKLSFIAQNNGIAGYCIFKLMDQEGNTLWERRIYMEKGASTPLEVTIKAPEEIGTFVYNLVAAPEGEEIFSTATITIRVRGREEIEPVMVVGRINVKFTDEQGLHRIANFIGEHLGAVKSVDLAVSMRDIMNASLTVQKIADKDDFIIPARILLSLVRSFRTRKQVGEIPAINVNLAISKEYRLTREHVKSKLPEAECYWS